MLEFHEFFLAVESTSLQTDCCVRKRQESRFDIHRMSQFVLQWLEMPLQFIIVWKVGVISCIADTSGILRTAEVLGWS